MIILINNLIGKSETVCSAASEIVIKIAEKVDYNGTIVHVYIWMEGTDADCVNGKAIENDTTTYDVTVKLVGVATSGR